MRSFNFILILVWSLTPLISAGGDEIDEKSGPLTLLLPMEAIPPTARESLEEFRINHPGIRLETGIPYDEGWYVVYRHKGLTYFFGPTEKRTTAETALGTLTAIWDMARDKRPALESAEIFIFYFDLDALFEALLEAEGQDRIELGDGGDGTDKQDIGGQPGSSQGIPGPSGSGPLNEDSQRTDDGSDPGAPPGDSMADFSGTQEGETEEAALATNGERSQAEIQEGSPTEAAQQADESGQASGEVSRSRQVSPPQPEPERLSFWERLRRIFRR